MYHNLVLVGLLSGVAGGKTTVARLFADLGALHLDADREAHAVLREDPVRKELVQRWGPAVLGPDGEVDRSRVGAIVFSGQSAAQDELRWLEARVHPRVRQRMQETLDAQARMGPFAHAKGSAPVRLVVLDVPLLLSSPWAAACDALIYVDTPRPLRLERAQQARGWDAAMLDRRDGLQDGESVKRSRAQYVIRNDGELEATRRQVRSVFERILAVASHKEQQPTVSAGGRAVDDDR